MLADSEPVSVWSEGKLGFFTKENAPKNSKDNCLECKVDNCKFDALSYYIRSHIIPEGKVESSENISYPFSVVSRSLDPEERIQALQSDAAQFARCAFKCDNNVMDEQKVAIIFTNGLTADFNLTYKGDKMTRKILVEGQRAALSGDLAEGELYIETDHDIKQLHLDNDAKGGHGGGDGRLLKTFEKLITSENPQADPELTKTSAKISLDSHLMVFAAEESRKTPGKIVQF